MVQIAQKTMKHLPLILSVGLLCTLATVSAQTVKQLEKQRKDALAAIETTNKLLVETTRTEKNSLNRLTLIAEKIDNRRKLIEAMNDEISAVDRHIAALRRELSRLKQDLAAKRTAYVKSLQTYQLRRSTYDELLFILSAHNAPQALRRMRYLREYAGWQKSQGLIILSKQQEVTEKQSELQRTRDRKLSVLNAREQESRRLVAEEKSRKQEVKQLGRRKSQLQTQLRRKQQQAQALNRQIERLITEETARAAAARKAAARKAGADKNTAEQRTVETQGGYAMTPTEQQLSTEFAANRGQLPPPLDGTYTLLRGFGEQQHQDFKYVRTNNSGIDLQTLPGTNARAVFAGEVSRVFAVPGYNTSVILRHGNYLTVYSNLSQVNVKPGDHVVARQIIGRIFTDPESGNETVLHFQIRKERDKLNPLLWIAR
jgi:septal ring factor EnvC (AmiA/AmiB activator)